MLLSAFFLILLAAHETKAQNYVTCERTYKKIGCFNEQYTATEVTLVNDRDQTSEHFKGHLIVWREFADSIHSLACRCNDAAKKGGYTYFAIRYWGICVAGKDNMKLRDMIKKGQGVSNNCANIRFQDCQDHAGGTECAGRANAEYMYWVDDKSGQGDVDGGYGLWSDWSPCTLSCGQGVIARERACDKPLPSGSGKDCSELGPSSETKYCKLADCPVDGNWTAWGQWDECSTTCGDGQAMRTRLCSNPAAQFGGRPCAGLATEVNVCNKGECPINGGWSEWSQPSQCSVSCGSGVITRTRKCTNPLPQHGGVSCNGDDEKSTPCSETPCPVNGEFGPWSSYSACSNTCGQGKMVRNRKCDNPAPANGGKNCQGENQQESDCNIMECPIHGNWSSWSSFGECDKQCGPGTQERTRACTNPAPQHNGDPCVGSSKDEKDCKLKDCAVDGFYNSWSSYNECSKSCGDGSSTRTRTCTNPAPANGGRDCTRLGVDSETIKCKIVECPIDGGFTQWGEFTACSKTCGVGSHQRVRTCTNPAPQHNGEECIGPVLEEKECKVKECPVNGNWAPWSTFKACSTTCGDGTQTRTRTCTNPAPLYDGKDCEGSAEDTIPCKVIECPIDGGWSDFSEMSSCSASCGIGTQSRTRTCTNPAPKHNGVNCIGPGDESRKCKIIDCPIDGHLSPWTAFTACSRTCGIGTQQRTRSCTNPPPQHGGQDCDGEVKEMRDCKVIECPIDGGFSEWSQFGECSKTCGDGQEERTRTCTNPIPQHGGDACVGETSEGRQCKVKECPIDGKISPWTDFSSCSHSCGDGRQTRARLCNNPPAQHGGKECNDTLQESKACKVKECPVDGGFSDWSSYSQCSKPCGLGTQERSRRCTNPAPLHGGKDCVGESSETKTCKEKECAVDGGFTDWGAFSACSATCGGGVVERSRNCTNPAPLHGGKDCEGSRTETKACKVKECPIDGGVSQWTEFSSCSQSCGLGVEQRTRACTNPAPQHGGDECTEKLTDSRQCKIVDCPIDGGYTDWTDFGGCSKTCGEGIQSRNRACTNPPPQYKGKDCVGDSQEIKSCKIIECPVKGAWSEWTKYSVCSEECGTGTQTRTRTCTNPAPAHGGDKCIGESTGMMSCKVKECPIDGGFSEWSNFRQCSKECGDGIKTRTRSCTNPPPQHGGKSCEGPTIDEDDCKVKECPVDGKYSEWSGFGECSTTCSDGTKTRTRQCTNPAPAHGGKQCEGPSSNTEPCNLRQCPVDGGFGQWSEYGKCSEECGNGIKTRTRICSSPPPAYGGKDCVGDRLNTATCKVKECPVDGGFGQWSLFGACSKTCGDGSKERTRSCTNPAPAHGGKPCEGPLTDIDKCKVKECPVDGGFTQWTSFGECSKTCGDGTQSRTRECTSPLPAHGGKECVEAKAESQPCKVRECPIDGGFSQWSEYDECTELCGGGTQERKRLCNSPVPQYGGKGCPGPISQKQECNTHKCKVDGGYGEWSSYGACSTTCGEGVQKRSRQCSNKRLDCSGPSQSQQACKVRECPVDGDFTPWSAYSACSTTCGSGTQERTRSCTNPMPANGGKDCKGVLKDSRACKDKECPIDGGLSPWSAYGKCSETCGNGLKTRTRVCTNPPPQHGGKDCSGELISSAVCKVKECPVHGNWGAWGDYGKCGTSCGGGLQMRLRECNNPAPSFGGDKCAGQNTMIRVCNTNHCPVDGGVSSWSQYTVCSKTCGNGVQTRSRTCTNPIPAYGGKICSEKLQESKACKVKECPIDGGLSEWSEYGSCSSSCGNGVQERTRTCTSPSPQHGGKDCAEKLRYIRVCKDRECPVNGGFSEWSEYSSCSETCGVGSQTRSRTCTSPAPAHGGLACRGPKSQLKTCEVKKCPVHGNWGSWSAYDACSKSCGSGKQLRRRKCNSPKPAYGGKRCAGSHVEEKKCNTFPCPVNGGFTAWTSFSACSETCGAGTAARTRTCTDPAPAHGGNQCVGPTSESKICMVKHCPVNGNWGDFGAYGACNKPCGGGVQERYRACNNPAPKYGGTDCLGFNRGVRVCNTNPCPVHGEWAAWGGFALCSVSCGVGTQNRVRTCTNPAPNHGGNDCQGSSTDSRSCTEKPCAVNGGWGMWSPYGFCTKSCGEGQQQRMRFCDNPFPAHGGNWCDGAMVTTRTCKLRDCPIDGGFTQWSSYSTCTKSCGVGSQVRTRTCTFPPPFNGGKPCNGATMETRTCEIIKCKVDGNWGGFGPYGPCSASCGGGVMERFRGCDNPAPAHGGSGCRGSNRYVRACNTKPCPVDGGFTQWSKYGACSMTCGDGVKTRKRFCTNPAPAHGGNKCSGPSSESTSCRDKPCAVNGNWGIWGNFGACNKPCGRGVQERYRACNNPAPAHGGRGCSGSNRYVRVCNTHSCPVNGNWGNWGRYGSCNKRCGGGVQQRLRACDNPAPAYGGGGCPGSNTYIRACNTHSCPVDGKWGNWGSFGACNKPCGGGVQERYRACDKPAPAHGGKGCPGQNRYVKVCNTHQCPVDGGLSAWSNWGKCDKGCGVGQQKRTRSCTNPSPAHGGKGCRNHLVESRGCKVRDCEVNGNWGHWGVYGTCNKLCGGGVQERYRYCNKPAPAHGGRACPGANRYVRACNTQKCAVNGNWGNWGSYGACNKPCGGGVQKRYRACNNPAPAHGGSRCPGSNAYVRTCNTHGCPINGAWSNWGNYGACSVKCGGGVMERFRYCNNPSPANGGRGCHGSSRYVAVCNTQKCTGWSDWGPWGNCLLPCSPTIRFRFRNCLAYPCPGGQNMVGVCNHLRRC